MEKKVSLKFNPKDTLHKMLQLKIFLMYDLNKKKKVITIVIIIYSDTIISSIVKRNFVRYEIRVFHEDKKYLRLKKITK